ncbi:CvpA family protein [Aequorivita ciconiae]|nr:CvpA family protein [Aequorivita sp. H23M31]
MNTIDIVLGLILIIAFFMGFRKGFLRVLASLIGLVAGVYCAVFFSGYVADYLVRWFDWSSDINRIAAFVITLVLVVLLFALLGRVLTKVANFALMGFLNKFMGGILNVIKTAFLISVIFMLVNSSENYSILTPEKRETSTLYAPIAVLAPTILPTIEKHLEELDLHPQLEFPINSKRDTLR